MSASLPHFPIKNFRLAHCLLEPRASQSPRIPYWTHHPSNSIAPLALLSWEWQCCLLCCQARNQKVTPFLSYLISDFQDILKLFFFFFIFPPPFYFENCQTYRKGWKKSKMIHHLLDCFHVDSKLLIFCLIFAFSLLPLSPYIFFHNTTKMLFTFSFLLSHRCTVYVCVNMMDHLKVNYTHYGPLSLKIPVCIS